MAKNNVWQTVVDYFLILGAIIGVGFASGKEIYVFFFQFGGASLIGLVAFGLLYVYLFFIIDYIKHKLSLNSYNEFNAAIFGKLTKITNVFIIINFTITSAGMLAGADYLFENFFNIGYSIPSIVLSVLAFVIVLGGIEKIKLVSNIIVPIMLFAIVINGLKNITPQNVNLNINISTIHLAIFYGLLFGLNNFATALPIIFESNQKRVGRVFSILTISGIILISILVLASHTFTTDMPMFEASKTVGKVFYYVYFVTLIMAIFSTLVVCTYNNYKIISPSKKSPFIAAIIVLANFILSNVGYGIIVRYLYVLSGIISGVYIIVLIVMVVIKLIKYGRSNNNPQKNKNN